jgi:cytochrome P450
MSATLAVLAVVFAIVFVVHQVRRHAVYKSISKIPTPRGQIPLFGITHKFIGADIKEYGKIFIETFSGSEPIQRFWFGTRLVIAPNTPEMFKTVVTSPHCLDKPRLVYDGMFADNGLLSNNGSMQEKHRKILNNAMTPAMLHQLRPIFEEKVARCMMKMGEKCEFDVFDDVAACTLEALLKGNFNYDLDCYGSEMLRSLMK